MEGPRRQTEEGPGREWRDIMVKSLRTLPNVMTAARLVLSPVLVLAALAGYRLVFFGWFLVLLATDALDGYLARRLNRITALGARLDGWADLAMWMSALISVCLLWPDIIKRERVFVLFALVSYLLPMIVGSLKYGKVPIYHCWSAKGQAVLMGIAVVLLIGADVPWLFRIAAILQAVAAAEDIVITLLLPEPHEDVRSFRQARHMRRPLERKGGE